MMRRCCDSGRAVSTARVADVDIGDGMDGGGEGDGRGGVGVGAWVMRSDSAAESLMTGMSASQK